MKFGCTQAIAANPGEWNEWLDRPSPRNARLKKKPPIPATGMSGYTGNCRLRGLNKKPPIHGEWNERLHSQLPRNARLKK